MRADSGVRWLNHGKPALRGLVAVATVTLRCLVAEPAAAEPREIGPAERRAAELAARYLEDGPAAWLPHLSEDSALARFGSAAAATELELLAGPAAGARWRLQTVPESLAADAAIFVVELPSGIDEILHLSLVPGEPDWKIFDVAVATREATSAEVVPDAGPSPDDPDGGGSQPPGTLGTPVLALAAAVLLLLLLAMAWRREASWGLRLVLIAALAVTAGLFLRRMLGGTPDGPVEAGSAPAETVPADRRIAWRRAAATGSDFEGETRESRIWQAQLLASELDLNRAEAILGEIPMATDGRSELLRARLGLLRMQPIEAVSAYERALEILPRHDGLLLEVARACELLGFEDRARRYYDELAELGSRQADAYYELVRRALIDDLWSKAGEHFETAWHLQPRLREEILGEPVLAAVIERRADLAPLLDFASVEEPTVRCRGVSRQPMAVPESLSASLIGSLLVLEAPNGGAVEIPGGCRLAPPGAEVFDAGSWQERRDRWLLDQDPATRRAGSGSASRHLAEAVDALVRRGRWQEVVRRTEGLPIELARAMPSLARNRAEALRRAGRNDAARQLLTDVAAAAGDQQRVDPSTLYQLAELLVEEQHYDLALRLMAKAHAELPFEVSRQRMLQVQIEKRLATRSLEYQSEHFQLIYPVERSHRYARNVARILEAERSRLKKWIPLESGDRITVFLLEFDDWRASHADGIEILGLFDGRIHVPFGEIAFFKPQMVSILTHELAHAMISELTGDRAPRWFQEGLAQHVEMATARINPIPGYRATGSQLAFPMIETVLDRSGSQELVGIAYEQAQWTLHFIESRHGVGAIHRLLSAFRDGSTTEEAIRTVLGQSIGAFDRELWKWCLEKAPEVWPRKVVDYDGLPV